MTRGHAPHFCKALREFLCSVDVSQMSHELATGGESFRIPTWKNGSLPRLDQEYESLYYVFIPSELSTKMRDTNPEPSFVTCSQRETPQEIAEEEPDKPKNRSSRVRKHGPRSGFPIGNSHFGAAKTHQNSILFLQDIGLCDLLKMDQKAAQMPRSPPVPSISIRP